MISFPSVLESIDDLTLSQIETLLSISEQFKYQLQNQQTLGMPQVFKNSLPVIATSFLENSTRTKHSFAMAVFKLGAHFIDFNVETSSLKKGESLEETLLTLNFQGVDLCVIRTNISHELNGFKKNPPIKIINGGDGINEHPTQALLDLMTLAQLAGGIENLKNKTVSIIGDNIHSRVGHSLIKLLPQFGIKVILSGPKHFLPENLNLNNVQIISDISEVLKISDFVYLLRIQKERHGNVSDHLYQNYQEQFGLSIQKLKTLNKMIPVLHPGPCNVGVEIDITLLKSNLYKGHLQVQNSVPMRMAILQSMLNNKDKNIGIIH